MDEKEITKQEYNNALQLISDYEYQEKKKHSATYKLNQMVIINVESMNYDDYHNIIFKNMSRIYYFQEYDFNKDMVMISTEIDINHHNYNDYWVKFDLISVLPKNIIPYEINQKVRYGNEDVVHFFKGYNNNFSKILIATELLPSDIDYSEEWVDTHMIHDNYKIRKGSNK